MDTSSDPLQLTPFPALLPWDIVVELFKFLDQQSLQAVSLLNRDFNAESNKYIWSRISLSTSSMTSTHLAIFQRDPQRTENVKSVLVSASYSAPDTLLLVVEALQCLISLEEMSLEVYKDPLVIETIFTHPFPFLLSTFRLSGFIPAMIGSEASRAFIKFLEAQKRIIELDVGSDVLAYLSDDALPNVEVVWSTPKALLSISPGRPITMIGVIISQEDEIDDAIRTFNHPSTHINSMGIVPIGMDILPLLLERLSVEAAGLSSLRIECTTIMSRRGEMWYENTFALFARFPSLHTLVWIDWAFGFNGIPIYDVSVYDGPSSLHQIVCGPLWKGSFVYVSRRSDGLWTLNHKKPPKDWYRSAKHVAFV